MGLDYSINLYVPVSHVEQALAATAKIACLPLMPKSAIARLLEATLSATRICDQELVPAPPLTIHLPSGRTLSVPFTSDFKTDPVSLVVGGKAVFFDTILLFPLDPPIRDYIAKDERLLQGQTHLEQGYAEIGYIYLSVRIGTQFAEFSFTAATSDMSRLFLFSESIHQTFRDLLIDAGGIAGLIDVEGNTFPLLADPTRSIEITEEDFPQEEISRWTAQDSAFDRYLELIMEKVEAATAPHER